MSAQCTKTAWLSSKLKQFALDEEIYLNYIESVLDGEEDRCEKISALEAILGEVLVSDFQGFSSISKTVFCTYYPIIKCMYYAYR